MKICIILTNSAIAHRSVYNSQEIGLAKALIGIDVSVDICTYSKKYVNNISTTMLESKNGHNLRLLEYNGNRLPGRQAFSLSLLKYLFKNKAGYDVVQLHDSTQIMTVLCALVCKKIKLPCVLYQGMYRDFDVWWKELMQKIYDNLLMRILFSSVSFVIGKTESALEYLRNKGMPEQLLSRVIPVGLDASVFSQDNCFVDNGMMNTVYDVLYIGKLEKRRRSNFLIELLLKLCSLRKNLKVCVIGDGPIRESFLKKTKALIKTGQITYLPSVENKELVRFYRGSKVALSPTEYEIFGMVILEAMYFGVPVIASAEAGPKTVISDSVDGVLLEGFDLDAWKDAVIELLTHEILRCEMGARASEKIKKNFLWGHLGPKFKQIYQIVEENKKNP